MTNIINQIKSLAASHQLKTINTAHFYGALLKNNLKLPIQTSKIKKYEALYNRKENGSIGAQVTAVLNSYSNEKGIRNFFNTFRHNTKEIQGLVKQINGLSEEDPIKEREQIRNSIIETVEKLGNHKNFNAHGETANITCFLVNQLNREIAELKKEATVAPPAPER